MKRSHIIFLFLLVLSLVGLTPWLSIDGKQYYMQLRSIVVDGDLNFYNEFAYYHPSAFRRDPELGERTPEGYIKTWFPLGAPLLCAPLYLAGFALTGILARSGFPFIANGYAYPEVFGYIVTSTCYGLIGLVLSFEIARRYFGTMPGFLAVIFIWLGSSAMAYLYFEPSMAHSVSIFTVSLFLLLWLRWRSSISPSRSFALGLLLGVMAMVRYQDVLFVLFPLCGILASLLRSRGRGAGRALILLALLILGGIVSFSPQMILWKAHYGSFIAIPQGRGFFSFLSPAVWSVLFSSYHGLFSWTPLLLIAFIGLVAFLRVDRPVAIILLVIFCLQVYFSSVSKDWWGGWAFGARRFISLTPVFVLGLATLLGLSRRRLTSFLLACLCSLLVLWNILFAYQYYSGKVPFAGDVSLIKIAEGQWGSLCELARASARVIRSPVLIIGVALGIALAFAISILLGLIFRRLASVKQRWLYALLVVVYLLAWDAVMLYEVTGAKKVFFIDEEREGRRPVSMLTLGRNSVFEGMGEELELSDGTKILNLENEQPFSRLILISYCRGAQIGNVAGRITVEYENMEPSEHEVVYGRDTYARGEEPPPRGPVVARTWYADEVELPPYRTPLPLPLWLIHARERICELKKKPPQPRRSYSTTIFLRGGGIPRRITLEAEGGCSLVITGIALLGSGLHIPHLLANVECGDLTPGY